MTDEAAVRLGAALGVLGLLLALERWRPWRHPRGLGMRRWPANFGLGVISAACLAVLLPAAAIGAALAAARWEVGLLHWLAVPAWVAVPVAFVALDLAIYWQHRATHAVPVLWRCHRVHHADPELDATSALRFHPFEIVLSMLFKVVAVVAIGAPPVAVLAFEVALLGMAMFNHAAIALPPCVSGVLDWVVVTPDMHRLHHGEHAAETGSCFGTIVPWWDWWFGTWRAAPVDRLVIGVPGWRAADEQRFARLLLQPLSNEKR